MESCDREERRERTGGSLPKASFLADIFRWVSTPPENREYLQVGKTLGSITFQEFISIKYSVSNHKENLLEQGVLSLAHGYVTALYFLFF